MAMKINGVSGAFSIPNINRRAYRYTKFDPTLKAMVGGNQKTVTVKTALDTAWAGLVQRSKQRACNDCFRKLPGGKSLADLLASADYVLHLLEPKQGFSDADVPDGAAAYRDIGLHPWLFFDDDPLAITCTLVHELAHVGGASTNAWDAPDLAHAPEHTLLSCTCMNQHREEVLGSIRLLKPAVTGGSRYA
jgi:hypothetical protein